MPAKTILITGASSGIGAALARAYAGAGVTLLLWGRDEKRLDAVAVDCRARGAVVAIQVFDLRDAAGFAGLLAEAPALDIAIFNAGLGGSAPADVLAETPEAARALAEVNFTAPVVGANVIAGAMAARGAGHIVLVGSITESFPLPMAPTYAATKAGLKMFAEALGIRMARHGVKVTLVSPGFIDTPMSRKVIEPKPFLISAEAAAAIIVRKIEAGARTIVVPWQFAVIRGFANLLPRALLRAILSRV
ncbi:MAG: SDR family NAD(P)-dependent oxidoreductase [Alphaproteobacteria bacterium]|nr:SDR family NAD(P)-dependent oxidoreductase [Alphaproteobacteria bacterium]